MEEMINMLNAVVVILLSIIAGAVSGVCITQNISKSFKRVEHRIDTDKFNKRTI